MKTTNYPDVSSSTEQFPVKRDITLTKISLDGVDKGYHIIWISKFTKALTLPNESNPLVRSLRLNDLNMWTQAVKSRGAWYSPGTWYINRLYVECMTVFENEIYVGGAIS